MSWREYIRCPGCGQVVRWYHRKGGCYNSSWHKKCAYSYEHGHNTAINFSNNMSKRYGLPTCRELYDLSQPQPQPEWIGVGKMEEFKKKYPNLNLPKPDFWYTK